MDYLIKKRCLRCNVFKTVCKFNKDKSQKDNLHHYCKVCCSEYQKRYHQTKEGVVSLIYQNQTLSSKRRKIKSPNYTKKELMNWVFNQDKFHELYEIWVKSGYNEELKPSIDRLDDYKSYSFNNIQITTWQKNRSRGHKDRFNGINNKHNKAVLQFDKQGNFIEDFYSISKAHRETNVNLAHISSVCNNKRKIAGGFKWSFK